MRRFCLFLISKKLKISLHDPIWINIRLNKWFYIIKLTTLFIRDQIQRLVSPLWRGETRLIKNHQILSSSKNDCIQSVILLILIHIWNDINDHKFENKFYVFCKWLPIYAPRFTPPINSNFIFQINFIINAGYGNERS